MLQLQHMVFRLQLQARYRTNNMLNQQCMKPKPVLPFLLFLAVISCTKEEQPDPLIADYKSVVVDLVDVSRTTIQFTADKDASLVVVETEAAWEASCPAGWISLSAYDGNGSTGFLIGATANRNFSREATVTILSGNATKEILVQQAGVSTIGFEINGVAFSLLPVVADTTFYLDGDTYLASRKVYLDSYFISETEITNAQWEAVMGSLPYAGENLAPNQPVVVNWNAITEHFLPAVNALTGYPFRLPTENEWEVAARGGLESGNTGYAGSMYIDEVAWHFGNSGGQKHDVGKKKPNEAGLYDMSGNVSEWCIDWYQQWTEQNPPEPESVNPTGPATGTEKVIRGGDYSADRFPYDRNSCRVTTRNYLPPGIDTEGFLYDGYEHHTGFRLVLGRE
jgi:formylglycine-generating enzyme required for sulfatase activity